MNPENWVSPDILYAKNDTALVCYIFNILQPIFNNFWQEISTQFVLSSAYLMCNVRLLLFP